jgi:hypothetical protein
MKLDKIKDIASPRIMTDAAIKNIIRFVRRIFSNSLFTAKEKTAVMDTVRVIMRTNNLNRMPLIISFSQYMGVH